MRLMCLATMTTTALLAVPALGSDLRDTQYGYSVSPPESAPLAAGAMMQRLVVFGPPEGGFAANMSVMVQEVRMTRDQYVQQSEGQFASAGMKLRKSSKREVSGAPAVLFEYEGPVNGNSLRFLSLAVILPERVLLLTYTATVDSFAAHEKAFRRSLESFELTRR